MENFDELIRNSEASCVNRDIKSQVMTKLYLQSWARPIKKYLTVLLVTLLSITLIILLLNHVAGLLLLIVTSFNAVTKHLRAYSSALYVAVPWWLIISLYLIGGALVYLRRLETFFSPFRRISVNKLNGEAMIMKLKRKATILVVGLSTIASLFAGVAVHAQSTSTQQQKVKAEQQLFVKEARKDSTVRCYALDCGPDYGHDNDKTRCYGTNCGPVNGGGQSGSTGSVTGTITSGFPSTSGDNTQTTRCYGTSCGPVNGGGQGSGSGVVTRCYGTSCGPVNGGGQGSGSGVGTRCYGPAGNSSCGPTTSTSDGSSSGDGTISSGGATTRP